MILNLTSPVDSIFHGRSYSTSFHMLFRRLHEAVCWSSSSFVTMVVYGQPWAVCFCTVTAPFPLQYCPPSRSLTSKILMNVEVNRFFT